VVMNQTRIVSAVPNLHFISIVRHPAYRFRSAWSWYRHSNESLSGVGGLTLPRFAELMSYGSCNGDRLDNATAAELHGRDSEQALSSLTASYKSAYTSVAAWWVRRTAASAFKYRTGLDASAEELVGVSATDPAFAERYAELLQDVAAGRVVLLVCERFDESLLLLGRMVFSSAKATTLPRGSTFPFPHLLYLPQKQQQGLEPLSTVTLTQLELLQPYDTVLHSTANGALDHLLRLAYPDRTLRDRDLRLLRAQTTAVASRCGESSGAERVGEEDYGMGEQEWAALCASLQRDNRQLVQDAWRRMDTVPTY
jgi:hypothetical protein